MWKFTNGLIKNAKFISTLLIAGLAILLFLIPDRIAPLDEKGVDYFDTAVKKALVAYGISRTVNSMVSVIQDSEVDAPSSSFAFGEVLDPLNDITERLSKTLITSVAALTTMRLVVEIIRIYTFKLIGYLLIVLAFLIWIPRLSEIARRILNTVAVALALRFALPACGLINDVIYANVFAPQIEANIATLKSIELRSCTVSIQGETEEDGNDEAERGVLGKIFEGAKDSIVAFWQMLTGFFRGIGIFIKCLGDNAKTLLKHSGVVVGAMFNLINLHIAIVIIQVIMLPMAVVWFIMSLVRGLFKTDVYSKLREDLHTLDESIKSGIREIVKRKR